MPRVRPTWDQYFGMQTIIASLRSDDEETQIGSVIVDNRNRIISTGYNGTPAGTNFPKIRPEKYPYMIHAEANAIISAKTDLTDCTLYVSKYYPCTSCAGLIANSGISRIVVVNFDMPGVSTIKWNGDASSEMFKARDIEVCQINIDIKEFIN